MVRMFLLLLDLIGIQGFVLLFGGLLLVLGFAKLFFGRVLFCRKSKREAFKDSTGERGETHGKVKKGGGGGEHTVGINTHPPPQACSAAVSAGVPRLPEPSSAGKWRG